MKRKPVMHLASLLSWSVAENRTTFSDDLNHSSLRIKIAGYKNKKKGGKKRKEKKAVGGYDSDFFSSECNALFAYVRVFFLFFFISPPLVLALYFLL